MIESETDMRATMRCFNLPRKYIFVTDVIFDLVRKKDDLVKIYSHREH